MNSQPFAQRRRPPSKRQLATEVYELLKRTHRVLKSNGVRVKADLWNPRGDGRTWIFIFEPTDKMPQSADPVDLVRRVLEAEGVEVLSVQKRENGTFGVAVCPSARGSSAAESLRSSQDSISELLREFDGLNPSFLTPPVSSNREITEEYMRTHGGEGPTLEHVMGEAARQAKKLVADCVAAPKTPPSESAAGGGVFSSPSRIPKFRSPLRKAVYAYLVDHRAASDKEILKWLVDSNPTVVPVDENGGVDLENAGKTFTKVRQHFKPKTNPPRNDVNHQNPPVMHSVAPVSH